MRSKEEWLENGTSKCMSNGSYERWLSLGLHPNQKSHPLPEFAHGGSTLGDLKASTTLCAMNCKRPLRILIQEFRLRQVFENNFQKSSTPLVVLDSGGVGSWMAKRADG